jgi:hypothetical protein
MTLPSTKRRRKVCVLRHGLQNCIHVCFSRLNNATYRVRYHKKQREPNIRHTIQQPTDNTVQVFKSLGSRTCGQHRPYTNYLRTARSTKSSPPSALPRVTSPGTYGRKVEQAPHQGLHQG